MRTQERILAAAERLFAADGFHAVGVDAIGAEAGVSGSAIYRHFSGKDEILAALFDQATAELLARLGTVQADPHAELERLVDVHLDFTLERSRLASIWQHEQRSLTAENHRTFARARELYIDRWMACLGRAYPERDRDELAIAMNAAQAAIMSVMLRPRSASEALTRAIVRDQAVAGLTTLARSRAGAEPR